MLHLKVKKSSESEDKQTGVKRTVLKKAGIAAKRQELTRELALKQEQIPMVELAMKVKKWSESEGKWTAAKSWELELKQVPARMGDLAMKV